MIVKAGYYLLDINSELVWVFKEQSPGYVESIQEQRRKMKGRKTGGED